MNISHDQYLKYIQQDVLDETLFFHAKGNYVTHDSVRHMSTLHHIPASELDKLTGNELRLNILDNEPSDQFFLAPLSSDHQLCRTDSCDRFDARPLSYDSLRALLSPLLVKDNSTYRRGYPSGGALYPVEVFCVNLNHDSNSWPGGSSVLHLLPASKTFELHTPEINLQKLRSAITSQAADTGSASWALIYFIYLPKALFKYRYRGYRLALMEVGSMYMLIDLRCKELSLKSRPWSGFTDHEITRLLRLNPALLLPACIQLVG